jgi:hypothetical protein
LIRFIEIPSVPRNEKRSEFRSEPFRRREKHAELRNFNPNRSAEDKNAQNSVPNHFTEEKKIGILFRPLNKKNFWKLVPKHDAFDL